jgi:hypothetical protein
MSGRDTRGGRGRTGSGFRQGRGRGRFQGRQGRSTNSKQLEIKFQTVTYDTVKDDIVQYMQKTYKHGQNIAVSLRDLKQNALQSLVPTRGQSTGTDPVVNSNEQAGMDIMYQAERERYLEQKDTLEQNLSKAYALIFCTYCNHTMQNRIKEHQDYETTIRDDPIELLSKIKVLMHDPIRAKYPFTLLTEAMIRMLNIKPIENEGLFWITSNNSSSLVTSRSPMWGPIYTQQVCRKHS